MGSPVRIYKVPHMSGGLNTRDARNAVQPTQSPDMSNMEWDRLGRVTRRGGFRQHIMDTYDPDPCYGLFRYVKSNMDKYLMTVFGTKLLAYKGDSPTYEKFEVKNDLTSGIERFMAQLQDNVYVSSWDEDGYTLSSGTPVAPTGGVPFRWNGSQSTNIGLKTPGPHATGVAVSGGGLINFTDANAQYGYLVVNDYGPLGIAHSGRFTEYYVANYEPVSLGSAAADGTVTLTWSTGSEDPLAERMAIYRTIEQGYSPGGAALSWKYYYLTSVAKGVGTYVDTKNDSEIDEEIQEDPLFWQAYPPQFKYCCVHKSRFFIAYVNAVEVDPAHDDGTYYLAFKYPSRLYWSDLYQADRIMGFVEVGSDRDKITQIVSFNNTLVIFKESTIHVLYGGGPADFTVREANAGLGCIAPRSVCVLDNTLIFLGNDGQFWAYDGVNFRRISEAIRPTLEELSNTRLELTANGVSGGRVFCSVPREM